MCINKQAQVCMYTYCVSVFIFVDMDMYMRAHNMCVYVYMYLQPTCLALGAGLDPTTIIIELWGNDRLASDSFILNTIKFKNPLCLSLFSLVWSGILGRTPWP